MKLLVMSAMLAYALAQDFQVQCPDIDVPLMAEILHHLRCTFFLQGNIQIEDLSTHRKIFPSAVHTILAL